MSGRAATDVVIPGRHALSVGNPGTQVPPGWAWLPLGQLATMGTGHTPSRGVPTYWDGNVPWLGIRDARAHHGKAIWTTSQMITQAGLDNSSARLLPAGTVALSRTASVGYVVQLGRSMATSQDFVTWTCGKNLDPQYLMHAIKAEGEDIRAFGEGSTHTTIYFPELKAICIKAPTISEQRRIVKKIDSLVACANQARHELDRARVLTDKYRAATLKFAHRTASENSDSIEIGKVIDDCRYGTAAKCHNENAGTPVLRIPNVSSGKISICDLKYGEINSKEANKLSLRIGDILIIRSNGSPKLVGVAAQVGPESEGMSFAGYLIRIRVKNSRLLPAYLLQMLRTPQIREEIEKSAKSTSGVHNINSAELSALKIPLPKIDQQYKIVSRIEHAFASINKINAGVRSAWDALIKIDQAILAKAFRGELVPQDPNDEPASVLLDRIRAERAAAGPAPKRGRRPRTAAGA